MAYALPPRVELLDRRRVIKVDVSHVRSKDLTKYLDQVTQTVKDSQDPVDKLVDLLAAKNGYPKPRYKFEEYEEWEFVPPITATIGQSHRGLCQWVKNLMR